MLEAVESGVEHAWRDCRELRPVRSRPRPPKVAATSKGQLSGWLRGLLGVLGLLPLASLLVLPVDVPRVVGHPFVLITMALLAAYAWTTLWFAYRSVRDGDEEGKRRWLRRASAVLLVPAAQCLLTPAFALGAH